MKGLPVSYVGPGSDLAHEAFNVHHRARDHDVAWFAHVDDLPLHRLRGVVAFAPLDHYRVGAGSSDDDPDNHLWGACDIARNLAASATIMLIDSGGDPSSRMMAAHVERGACHPRGLVYRPGGCCQSPDEVLDAIEAIHRSHGVRVIGSCTSKAGHKQDFNDVMAHSDRFERLIFAAATTEWTRYDDLASTTHYGTGTVRNIVSDIGNHLGQLGIVNPDAPWRMTKFARLVAEHHNFIRVAGRCHGRRPAHRH